MSRTYRFLGLALLLVHCGGDTDEGGEPPVIVGLSSTPPSVAAGGTVVINWKVRGADEISLMQEDAKISTSYNPTFGARSDPILKNTMFELIASNEHGDSKKSLEVPLRGSNLQPIIHRFLAVPNVIYPGVDVTLSWDTENVLSASIETDAGTVVLADADLPEGRLLVSPTSNMTYVFKAVGSGGEASHGADIIISAPEIDSFIATPPTINQGDSSTLSWVVRGATTVAVTDGGGGSLYSGAETSRSIPVNPTASETYTLTASDGVAQVDSTVRVTVNPSTTLSIVSFNANPNPGLLNGSTTLSWETTAATSLRVLAEATEIFTTAVASEMNAGSTFGPLPTTTNNFTLEISDGTNTINRSIVVDAHSNPPSIVAFEVNPPVFDIQATVQVVWQTTGASSVELLANNAPAPGFGGELLGVLSLPISMSTTFELRAINGAGTATASYPVYMLQPEAEPNNTYSTAQSLGTGGAINAALAPIGDLDFFSIEVEQGGGVEVRTAGTNWTSCSIDTEINLYDRNGQDWLTWGMEDQDQCDGIDPTDDPDAMGLAAGTYYVSVEEFSTNAGVYSIIVRAVAP